MSLIFSDGFESGDFTAWNGSVTGSGDSIGASSIQAKTGTYSARAATDAVFQHRAYIRKDFTAETTVSARVEIYLDPGFSPSNYTEVMYFYDSGGGQVLAAQINSDMTISVWNAVASAEYLSAPTISTGVWHTLEMMAVIGGASSETQFWLDGTLIINQPGINLGTNPIDQFRTGHQWSGDPNPASVLYIDDVTLCREQMAAPSVDATSTNDTGAVSMTVSHSTSGADRLMLVGITLHNESGETVTSVTYNGSALSPVGSAQQGTESRVEIWSLVAPDTGAHDVVVTFSAQLSRNASIGIATFTGVDQSTPLGSFASANGNSAGPATVNVSSATNELVFDTVACQQCSSLSVGAGQTQRWNLSVERGNHRAAGSTEAGASSVTMSWTMGASRPWAIGAVPIKPSGGSPPAVDSVTSDTTHADTLTISHTTSGTNRLMLVGISFNPANNEVVSTVTYNGASLSNVGSVANGNDTSVELWSLVAPDLGTHDVVITFSARLQYGAVAGVRTFTGVHQVAPLGTFASASGTSAGPATVNVSSGANQLVFDTVSCETCTSFTVGAGQSEEWNLSRAGGFVMGAASTEPGAATVTMSWALGSSDYWAIGAVPINPS